MEARLPLCKRRGPAQPQKHLLLKDLIEDCLRDQGFLAQRMPANQEVLFRRAAFLGPMVVAGGYERSLRQCSES